ncbi:hypothetical protein JX265_003438 [Neoarthrinium moseri]|uniref:chitinase n=1 Tax=Neoarthrinium moseri TaxID=1658444 RepID=A0A9Q0AS81_9PEZI|nr:hypothetical protein JX265_003438 [Neoarthrinium moseri]
MRTCVLTVLVASLLRPCLADGSTTPYVNAVYYGNWASLTSERNFPPYKVPVASITHLFYAFAEPHADGTVTGSNQTLDTDTILDGEVGDGASNSFHGCVKQLRAMKQQNRHLKVMLSIGGWVFSQQGHFATLASNKTSRDKFVQSAIGLMIQWGFDGLDVVSESPRDATEGQNYLELLRETRAGLDKESSNRRHQFLLTIASSAIDSTAALLPLGEMAEVLDFFNVKAYDFAFATKTETLVSGHQANLFPNTRDPLTTPFSIVTSITGYTQAGVPSSKIVLGMPIFGRSYNQTDGMGKTFTSPWEGSWPGDLGVWDYKALPKPGALETYDNLTVAVYSYNASTKELITYDNVASVKRKIEFAIQKRLRGAMFWEASADGLGEKSLVQTSAKAFGDDKLDKSDNWQP